MSKILTGTGGSVVTTVQVPTNGDPANELSVETFVQTLINNDVRLNALIAAITPNKIVASYQGKITAPPVTLGGSAVITGCSVSVLNVVAGDILLVDGWIRGAYTGGSGGTVKMRVGGVALDQVMDLTTSQTVQAFMSREAPGSIGTVVVDAYFTESGGASGTFQVGSLVRVVHLRP